MKITIYDESNAVSENVHLTNKVDTVNVEFVGLSLPNGVLRLEYNNHCTHFVITLNGKQWCLAVNEIQNLGNGLFDFFYEVDYLKDYWMKNSGATLNATIYRTTNQTMWAKYVPDPLFPVNNNPTIQQTVGSAVPWYGPVTGGVFYIVSIIGATTYETPTLYRANSTQIAYLLGAATVSEKVRNVIARISVVPYIFSVTLSGENVSSNDIDIYSPNWLGGQDIASLASVCGGLWDDVANPQLADFTLFKLNLYPGSSFTNLSPVNLYTGITIPHNDWRDGALKKYTMYIPMVGTVGIDGSKHYGNIKISYFADLFDGSVRACINDDYSTMTKSVKFPTIPIGNLSNNGGILQEIVNAINGAATTSIATKNPITTKASLAVQAVDVGLDLYNYNLRGVSYSTPSDYEILSYPQPVLTTLSYDGINTIQGFANSNGYIANKYLQKLSNLTEGYYYWIDFTNAVLYGEKWYVDGVKQRYHNQRIYV